MEAEGRLSETDREMLTCHYNAPDHTLTGRQMSSLMGWGGQTANNHYGKLARRVAEELDWEPTEREGYDGYHVSGLILGSRPNRAFEWTMRPQVVGALELLGWPGLALSNGRLYSGTAKGVTERAAYVWQQSLERDSRAAKLAKAHHGYQCQACDIMFSSVYGSIGDDFVEAHHLVPLSDIELGAERTYTPDDFAVLCSNCHRMIHRWPDPSNPTPGDLDGFRRMLRDRREGLS
jgi:predicted HNH restriction endonuclease